MSQATLNNPKTLEHLEEAQLLRQKNIDFFKSHHPNIYERFHDYKLKNYQVSFNTDINQFDLLLNGKSIYNNRPVAEALEEVSDFEKNFAPGNRLNTIHPPFGGYSYERYFHKCCAALIKESPFKATDYRGYSIPNFLPLVIFNGVGAGYQVEKLIARKKIINCLIVEPVPDLFAASLYIVDWTSICRQFIDNPERNIHFILGPVEDEYHLYGYTMRYLYNHCPLYPLTTMFLNHKNLDIYRRVTQKINDDTFAFVSVWGWYDDEINQINNCIHNLHLKTPKIKANQNNLRDIPVFIIGAGPSLDERIEDLKRFKDKALIISCGTAIHPLYKHGIKPDIHFELESHLVTLTSLHELDDPGWVKSIPILGPAQLSPRLYQYFEKRAIYFKAESVTSFLFGDDQNSVARGTPTCTNGALAVFGKWAFKNIYLFGMDFGYRDIKVHHASGSIYYNSDNKDIQADADVSKDATMTVKAVDGSEIKTKPILYTAMRTAETTARAFSNISKFHNCSNGAAMEDIDWIKSGTFPIKPEDFDGSLKHQFLEIQFSENHNITDIDTIHSRLDIIDHNMKEVTNYIELEFNKIELNLYSMTTAINHISSFFEEKIKPKIPAFYFFMRGSLWHLFYIGYSHALCIEDEEKLAIWIETWRTHTLDALHGMYKHYHKVVYKEYDYENDPWTSKSTSDPED